MTDDVKLEMTPEAQEAMTKASNKPAPKKVLNERVDYQKSGPRTKVPSGASKDPKSGLRVRTF